MVVWEVFLNIEDKGDLLDSVEVLIKKYEDFDKVINVQEEKIVVLQVFVDQFIVVGYYVKGDIFSWCNEVLDRW